MPSSKFFAVATTVLLILGSSSTVNAQTCNHDEGCMNLIDPLSKHFTIGYQNGMEPSTDSASSIGTQNYVNGSSDAIGLSNTVTGDDAVVLGFRNEHNQPDSLRPGNFIFGYENNITTASRAIAMGAQNKIEHYGDGGIAIGVANEVTYDHAVVLGGTNNKASALYATVLGGSGAEASGISSLAHGPLAVAMSSAAVAMGEGTAAVGMDTTALGFASVANAKGSVALGGIANTTGMYSTAIGYNIKSEGMYSFCAGVGSVCEVSGSVGLGYGSESRGDTSFAAGLVNKAKGLYGVAIGENNEQISGLAGTVFGKNNLHNQSDGALVWGEDVIGSVDHCMSGGTMNHDGLLGNLLELGNGFMDGLTPVRQNAFEATIGGDIRILGNVYIDGVEQNYGTGARSRRSSSSVLCAKCAEHKQTLTELKQKLYAIQGQIMEKTDKVLSLAASS